MSKSSIEKDIASHSNSSRIIPTEIQAHSHDEESQYVWGFADTRYQVTEDGQEVEITGKRYATSGQRLPNLLPWITDVMKVDIPHKQRLPDRPTAATLPQATSNEAFTWRVKELLAENQVSGDLLHRLRSSHGHSLQDMYKMNCGGAVGRIPDLVLFPEDTAHVEAIIDAAREFKVRLIPYGGGTNVSGALTCPSDEIRTIAAVGMRRMSRILWIDKKNRLARIEAGATGRYIDAALANHGLTLGHEPDSVEFSTLGGWIATKASGMKKNRYGNIEDIVLDVEMVALDGIVARAASAASPPRESVGIDLRSFALGSEGGLGIITSAVVRVFPLPEVQHYGSVLFPSFEQGFTFMKAVTHDCDPQHLPASMRLVDNTQFQFSIALKPAPTTWLARTKSRLEKAYVTRFRGFSPNAMVAATLVFEGSARQVGAQESAVYALAKKHGGMKAGASNGQRGYELTFAIAYIRDFALSLDILAESFETSCTWSAAENLCAQVRKRVHKEHAALGLPGKPFFSARISQVYVTGVTVYFYLAIYTGAVEDPVGAYGKLETAARDEILKCGGSLSHHHGVGTLRREFLPRVLSPGALKQRCRFQSALDPDNVFLGREVGSA